MRPDLETDPNRPASAPGRASSPALVSAADLPPPGTTRWVISRKAAVVAGVRQGLLTVEEALERYALSLDEFVSWNRLFTDFGVKGLRTTRIKEYRGRANDRRIPAEREGARAPHS